MNWKKFTLAFKVEEFWFRTFKLDFISRNYNMLISKLIWLIRLSISFMRFQLFFVYISFLVEFSSQLNNVFWTKYVRLLFIYLLDHFLCSLILIFRGLLFNTVNTVFSYIMLFFSLISTMGFLTVFWLLKAVCILYFLTISPILLIILVHKGSSSLTIKFYNFLLIISFCLQLFYYVFIRRLRTYIDNKVIPSTIYLLL